MSEPSDEQDEMDIDEDTFTEIINFLERSSLDQTKETFETEVSVKRKRKQGDGSEKLVLREIMEKHFVEQSKKLIEAYDVLFQWVSTSLPLYKKEFEQLLFPLYARIYVELIMNGKLELAENFLTNHYKYHKRSYESEIINLKRVKFANYIFKVNFTKRLAKGYKYYVRISSAAYDLLVHFVRDKKLHKLEDFLCAVVNFSIYAGQPKVIHENSHETTPVNHLFSAKFDLEKINNTKVDFQFSPPSLDEVVTRENTRDDRTGTIRHEYPTICLYNITDPSKSSGRNISCCLIDIQRQKGVDLDSVNANGPMIITGHYDSSIKTWNWDQGEKIKAKVKYVNLVGHKRKIMNLSLNVNKKWLLSCAMDRTIRLWNKGTKKCFAEYATESFEYSVSFSSNFSFCSSSADHTVKLWVTDRKTPQRLFSGHTNDVFCAVFHPGNEMIASASCDKTVRIWDIRSGKPVRVLLGHRYASINGIKFSPDGVNLVTWCEGNIFVWDLRAGKNLYSFIGAHNDFVNDVEFKMTGNYMLSSGMDCTTKLWDLSTSSTGNSGNGAKLGNRVLRVFGSGDGNPIWKMKYIKKNLCIAASVRNTSWDPKNIK